MSWLRSWGLPCIRVNGGDIDSPEGPTISLCNGHVKTLLRLDHREIDLNDITVVWYRKWSYSNHHRRVPLFSDDIYENVFNIVSANLHLYNELQTVSQFIFSQLASAKWLGNPEIHVLNKLKVLMTAAQCGFDIPDTLITTQPSELSRYCHTNGEVIAKPSSDMLLFRLDDQMFLTFTALVPQDMLGGDGWQGGFPSLFQRCIHKRYDIRVFYIDGDCYSMAMLTQQSLATAVDSRRCDYRRPIRTVPYKLPAAVEGRIRSLMRSLNLNTGSLDLIRADDGRFVFLEVNPIGQFGMVSIPCNYRLEQKVAKALKRRFDERQAEIHESLSRDVAASAARLAVGPDAYAREGRPLSEKHCCPIEAV